VVGRKEKEKANLWRQKAERLDGSAKKGNYRHRNLFPRNGKWLNRKIFDDNLTCCCE
jgi:hypothetical protein